MLFFGVAAGDCAAVNGPTEIRVGSELEFPPYAFVDENGKAAGFSIDLIRAVTEAMGISTRISTGTWDTVWTDLVDGRIDVLPIVAKLPERTSLVDFSLPHTETFDAFFVRDGREVIRNIEGARGKEIAVMRSDAAHHALLERDFQGRLVLVDTIPEGLSLVASGRHDAFLCSKLIGTLAINMHGIKGLTAGPPVPDYKRVFSFAVKKGDTELLEKLNQGLLIVKASGEYQEIYDRWLSAEDPWQKYRKYLVPFILAVAALILAGGFWLFMLRRLVKKRTRELTERNDMLSQLRDGLDITVARRTAELSSLNDALLSEIAERKRTEEALRVSEERLRLAVSGGSIGIWEWDVAADQIEWNDQFKVIFGLPTDVSGLTLEKFLITIHPEDRSGTELSFRTALKQRTEFKHEHRIIWPDGSVHWVVAIGRGLYDPAGHPSRMLGCVLDITELKQAELKYKTILDTAMDCFYIIDAQQGNILEVNDAYCSLIGYGRDELLKMNLRDIEASEDTEKIAEHMQFIIKNGSDRFETRHRTKDGRILDIETSVNYMREANKFFVFMQDITERKQAEKEKEKLQAQLMQAQKMEAIGHLAGGVAHDFNNILSAIVGYAHVTLMKMKKDDPLRNNIDQILASAERAGNLTKSLLAFSRKQVMQMTRINISDVVLGMTRILDRIIGEDIYLKVNTADHGLIINADVHQIEHVLMNLATNARDAMPDGGTLTVTTDEFEIDDKYVQMHQQGHAGKFAVLTVSDSGTGMDEEIKEKMFDPFFTTKEVGKGTGLGLAMIYGTIKQHNGFINVCSEPGKGTTFRIYLPMSVSDGIVNEHTVADTIPSGSETVLLVEDDEAVRSATKGLLKAFGYSVLEAGDVKQAVEIYMMNKDIIQLVITDIIMPGQSGKELHNELVKITGDIKMLFVSGYPADMLAKKEIADNEINFISKPFKPETLLNKVRMILDK